MVLLIYLFIYLGFYIAFKTVQVISQRVVGRAEETSTYSSLGFCTVNCRPTASNYQLSHFRPSRGSNPGLRGGRRECYHSATVAPIVDIGKAYDTVWKHVYKSSLVWPEGTLREFIRIVIKLVQRAPLECAYY